MARRIDTLYCSRETAAAKIQAITEEIQSRAQATRQEVTSSIGNLIEALRVREQELTAEIDRVAAAKVELLEQQLLAINSNACLPAPSEDPDQQPDPNRFLLDADAVITFRVGDGDFSEKIPIFGRIAEKSTYSSQSFAKGPALGILKVHNPSYLWVCGCDRQGARRTEGGDNITVALKDMNGMPTQDFDQVEVEDMKDGRYKIKFVPLAAANYILDIAIGPEGESEAICGGPFQLTVRMSTEYKQIGQDCEVEGKSQLGFAGDAGNGSPDVIGSVHHPSGVDFDHSGRFVFVADQSNHRIQIFSADDKQPICTFGKKGLGTCDFDTPCDVVADRENRVVISDLLNHRIQILEFNPRTLQLRHLRSIGGRGQAEGMFEFPKGLGMTEHGHLLVSDSGNHRVQVFDMNDGCRFVRKVGDKGVGDGQFTSPLDIAVNCNGEVLVSDSTNRIQVFDNDGVFQRSFGSTGRKDGFFNYPVNIAVNDENALFVCDQGNHRVQVLNATDGTFLHKWGGSRKKKAEGEEDAAADAGDDGAPKEPEWTGLRRPAGIAVNASGDVVVADYQNNTLYSF